MGAEPNVNGSCLATNVSETEPFGAPLRECAKHRLYEALQITIGYRTISFFSAVKNYET
jgi:hypothetical protein